MKKTISAADPAFFEQVKSFENKLDDVMELINLDEIKSKLKLAEDANLKSSDELTTARLGIIYHEVALNLSFFIKDHYKGFAQKSFDILSRLAQDKKTSAALLPFIRPYRASALALMAAETKKLHLISQSFELFNEAIKEYSAVSYLPEFMRGSVAENLPWFYFKKRKLAKIDFQSIIDKYEANPEYANWKVMSFTYWAWAKQRPQKKYRQQALAYLEMGIALDPRFVAGRKRCEELKQKMSAN